LVSVVALGTGLEAAVRGAVEVEVESALVRFCAVGGSLKTTYALHRTTLACVRITVSPVLTQRTLQRTDTVADVEIVDQRAVGSSIRHVAAALALEEGRPSTGKTSSLARLACAIRSTLVAPQAAQLHAGVVFEVQPQACTGYIAAGAIFGRTETCIAVDIALIAAVGRSHAVLSCRTVSSAIGRRIDQVMHNRSGIAALRARGSIPSETQSTTLPTWETGIVAQLAPVGRIALAQTLHPVVVEVGHSADVGTGLAVGRGSHACQTLAGAELAGESGKVPELAAGAVQ
jgi:hypothetical protein